MREAPMDSDVTELSVECTALPTSWSVGAGARGTVGPDAAVRARVSRAEWNDPAFSRFRGRAWSAEVGLGVRRYRANGAEWMPWAGVELGDADVVRGWGQVAQKQTLTARTLTQVGPILGVLGVVPLGGRFAVRTGESLGVHHLWYHGNRDAELHRLLGGWEAQLLARGAIEWRATEHVGVDLGIGSGFGGWRVRLLSYGAWGELAVVARL
jgi:hypothetical protein